MFPKPQRWQSKKYRDAAKGQNCTMRLPGCTNDTETVVLAHRPGAGMGTKHSDWDGCDCCNHCHDILDGRKKLTDEQVLDLENEIWNGEWFMSPQVMINERFKEARLQTIINRIERGVLK